MRIVYFLVGLVAIIAAIIMAVVSVGAALSIGVIVFFRAVTAWEHARKG